MRRGIGNLEASLRESGQPAYVIYVNPLFDAVLGESPVLRKLPTPRWFSLHESRPNATR